MTSFGGLSLGDEVTLQIKGQESFSGVVFAYDKKLDTLVLEENGGKDVRTIRFSAITSIDVLKASPREKLDKVPNLQQELVKKRETQGLEVAAEVHAKIGLGVSSEAQRLFDALSKTYDVRWDQKHILCNQLQITISPPYLPDNCSGPDPTSLERIKQVVKTILDKVNT